MDFIIPLDKNDLLKPSDHYYVREIVSPRNINQALDETRTALEANGPKFILNHFHEFFSVILHGNKLEFSITLRAFDRIARSVKFLLADLEQKRTYGHVETVSVLKMHAYLLSHIMCYLETSTLEPPTTGKKKKGAKKSDNRDEWEHRREGALLNVYGLLQLPLQKLWQPPIVEESFVMLLADICYKILEHDTQASQKDRRSTIWQILGTLVKKYLHGITCTIKIIQLVKMYDTLAVPLAVGVVSMVTESNCPSFINEIAREIEQSNSEEAESRNISAFIEAIASNNAQLILNILDYIVDYLESDCYVMRNCAIGVLGTVILNCLTNVNLKEEDRQKRDQCFQHLETHMLDTNAYVRSKAFQTLQKLGCEGALTFQFIDRLLPRVLQHLKEKSATMKKQALQLLRVLLESNGYGPKFDKQKLVSTRDQVVSSLQEVQAKVVAESASGDDERLNLWHEVAPKIQKALRKMLEDEEDEDNDDDDDEDDDDAEDIAIDEEFEKIRQYIIDHEFSKAVKTLKTVCRKAEYVSDMSGMQRDEKEYCYLMFLIKIFLESQQDRAGDKEKFTSVAWKKRKGQIQDLKRQLSNVELCLNFVEGMEAAIPIVESMLYAAAPAVAIEACSFLGVAFQFNITGAAAGIRKALSQVFSREESVKNNVALVYKQIYLSSDSNNLSHREQTIMCVDGLVELFKGLQYGQSPALMQLVTIWHNSGDLNEEHFQVMWEKYSLKIPGTTADVSRIAIALLTMIAHSHPKLMTVNLKTLVKIGLQTYGKDNLELARDTCRALMKIRQYSEDSTEPIRYPNDHEIFTEITSLLLKNFDDTSAAKFVSFATDAINVIYHLANQPQLIIPHILQMILEDSGETEVPEPRLAKLLYVIGHVCIRHMVFLDTTVYKEQKRRNAIRDEMKGKSKNKSKDKRRESVASAHESARKARRSIYRSKPEDTYEDEISGATADDADAEAIDEALEQTIITGDGYLTQFVPLVRDVCQHPERYKMLQTQGWGVLALTKMMTVSSEFCKQNLQLLITILEKSNSPEIRSNILIGLSDLMIRFPNEVEPWTSHIYGRLRDQDVLVRKTAMRVLSNLVKREMIRVKGQMSEMALCIVDADSGISNDAKQFFCELSQKGNVLYNILPDILSRLTTADTDIDEDDLHTILKHILGLLQKEREIDALLDKICARFRLATTERQWTDLSYCLTLLPLGKKGIIRLTGNLGMLKDKINNKQVYRALKDIVDGARKKADTKDVAVLLEDAIEKLINADDDNPDVEDQDRTDMPPPLAPPRKISKRRKRPQNNSDEEDEDDEAPRTSGRNMRKKVNQTPKRLRDDDDDDDNDLRSPLTPKNRSLSTKPKSGKKLKRKSSDSEEEQEDFTPTKRRNNSSLARGSAKKKKDDSCDEKSEDSTPRRLTRSSEKSKK